MRGFGFAGLFAALAGVALGGCSSGDGERQGGVTRPGVVDPGPVHVHGLGIDPEDGALFVATHTGLFRAAPGDKRSTRVGDRHQDTMGFTVVGPGRFLGSGHPDLREDAPAFLGLISSDDAGRSWKPVSLRGKADFHVLEAQGRQVYGFGSDWDSRAPQLLASEDGGRHWEKRTFPEPLIGLAIKPGSPRTIMASGETQLHASLDGGSSWRTVEGPPGLLAWPAAGQLYVLDPGGAVHVSGDAGRSWQQPGDVGGQPAAFEASSPTELYAALHDGTIKYSRDAGKTWSVRARP